MPLVSDRCICLRRVEFSETSQILHLYTRQHGLLRVIAKGAHRRTKAGASNFDGGVDLLDVGESVFTHDLVRDLQTLTEWRLVDGHPQLRSSLRGLHLAMFTGELFANLFEEHDPQPALFDRFQSALSDFGTPRQEETFLALLLDLLRESGYLPELWTCVQCGGANLDRDAAFMSASRGGIVCRNCEGATPDRVPFDVRLLRLSQSILRLPRTNGSAQRLPRLTRHQTDPLNRILIDHVEQSLSKRLRLPKYVLAKSNAQPAHASSKA
jgi:DNA repair protein RecO (recombination protein O)